MTSRTPLVLPAPSLFRSFWIGGYECATHINTSMERLDMIAGVQHDEQADHDYHLLTTMGIRTARDGVRWHLIDRSGDGNYDWSSFEPMFEAAQRQGVQVIWDVCHYGLPDALDILKPAFVNRFERFARALAQFIKDRSAEVPFYSPMNEISFFAWGASRHLIYPFAEGRDEEIKAQLVRAAAAGCAAILEVEPRARFVFPEPVVHAIPARNRPELVAVARQHHEAQFEAWDMIAGYKRPDLGGHPRFLDILGANFYSNNQWEVEGSGLRWDAEPRDERWIPLSGLLAALYNRYQRPLFLAETSHVGSGRARWILEIGEEVYRAREEGTPVDGICLYPIIDRYDWQVTSHWHNSGLWDLERDRLGKYVRVLDGKYAAAVRRVQDLLATVGCV